MGGILVEDLIIKGILFLKKRCPLKYWKHSRSVLFHLQGNALTSFA